MITARQKESIERLRRDSDFTQFLEYLNQERELMRGDLEAATAAVQSHKLQGYCLALSDLIQVCSSGH